MSIEQVVLDRGGKELNNNQRNFTRLKKVIIPLKAATITFTPFVGFPTYLSLQILREAWSNESREVSFPEKIIASGIAAAIPVAGLIVGYLSFGKYIHYISP